MKQKACFHGGNSFEEIGTDFSNLEKKDRIIRADMTDAWYSPAPMVKRIISKDLDWFLRNTPPIYSEGLVKTISEVRGIPEKNLVVGGGSSDLIFLALPVLMGKKKKAVLIDPMYGEYEFVLKELLGKKIVKACQKKEDGFKVDIDSLLEKIDSETGVVIFVNPNNPTGRHIPKNVMIKLLSAIPKEVFLVVDEAYIDYIDISESLETLVKDNPNLIILKSMSKIYALSGARIGYLVANESLISKIRSFTPPWSVNLIGQVAAVTALKNEAYYRKKIRETTSETSRFIQRISRIKGLKPYPACANFFLVELMDRSITAPWLCSQMAKKGIFLRNPDSQSDQFGGRFVRISAKKRKDNQIIESALKQLLG